MTSQINFKLLCEQIILEESLRSDLYQITTDVRNSKANYAREKRVDKEAALQTFNTDRIALRDRLRNLIWGLPLNQDGTPIDSEEKMDNYIFKKEQEYPGIVLLHQSLLPRQ